MAQLIMVEGLPGAGKSTATQHLEGWLAEAGSAPVHRYGEGRADHPADHEQVAILSNEDCVTLLGDFPADADALIAAAERFGDMWLVRYGEHSGWPRGLRRRVADYDSYDGQIAPELHREVLAASWADFGERTRYEHAVYLFECAALQNPTTALLCRFDQPQDVVESHVREILASVEALNPAIVYLDPGDPAECLRRAADERPQEWVENVVNYHTKQGYGLSRGLEGFDGYVDVMRARREVELEILDRIDVATYRADVSGGDYAGEYARIQAFLTEHVDLADPLADPIGA